MRDAIKNYRMIIKGKLETSSDTESEPLMSSINSLSRSFGTIAETPVFKADSDTDVEKAKPNQYSSYTTSTPLPIDVKLHFSRRLLFPNTYDTPELDIDTDDETIYDNCQNYAKICGTLPGRNSLLNKSTSPSLSYKGLDSKPPTHDSIVTIFAIWNTTMGSSLLAMSWGFEKSGLFPGILISLFIAAISLYTAYIIVKVNEKHGIIGQTKEMPDLCRLLLGRWAEILAKIFSLIVLIGANIVYWILMSNFLYNSVVVLYGYLLVVQNGVSFRESVICPKEMPPTNLSHSNLLLSPSTVSSITKFYQIWDLYSTVPIILAVLMFPLLNFRSATFFTKFNSLGTISVLYVMIFVASKATTWGIHLPNINMEFHLKPTFFALSGMLSLSYFIHNIIISIMRNNKHQEHNGRDLTIGFGLVTFTYLFMGILYYIAFPLAKQCIEDNILNNFDRYDTMTILARILLMFQLFTVFPLMCYMLRNDVMSNMNMMFKNYNYENFSYGRVIVLNLAILVICILFACFLPRIGTLIRYTGALSGLVYIYMLPSLLMMASLKKERRLTTLKSLFFISIIVIGFLNLGSQFFITD